MNANACLNVNKGLFMGLQKVNKYSVVGGKKFAKYKLCILHEYFRFDIPMIEICYYSKTSL